MRLNRSVGPPGTSKILTAEVFMVRSIAVLRIALSGFLVGFGVERGEWLLMGSAILVIAAEIFAIWMGREVSRGDAREGE